MRPLANVGLVVAAYAGALAIAVAVVAIHVAATSGPDRQTYGAMFAFGDEVLFLAALGTAAVPGTGLALFFLRPYPRFWRVLSVLALAIAGTALVPLVVYAAPQTAAPGGVFPAWAAAAPLRVFLAPLFAPAFAISAVFAPGRAARIPLVVSTGVEVLVFIFVVFTWLDHAR